MANLLPYLDVTGPDGQRFRAELNKTRLTIGRLPEYNDISLEPDPQQLITRLAHCAIERTPAGWWVIDNGSVNRTFVRWGETMKVIEGGEPINEDGVICILGRLSESGDPVYWELEFHDPLQTRRFQTVPLAGHLEYDWVQAKLFRVSGRLKEEIDNLRPQEHKLIRYMDQRNRANGYVPVMCSYDELITAVWGEEAFGRTEADINRLVWELRQKIETDQKEARFQEPRFLETVRGLGYRLVTRATAK